MFRSKCHEMHSIDLTYLARNKCLRPGVSGRLSWSRHDTQTGSIGYRIEESGLRLIYRISKTGDESRDINELIPFTYTSTNFSGRRRWFKCPSCGNRCRILYGGFYFRCRRCHDLKYESQYEPAFCRAASQSHALRKRLGHVGGLDDQFPPKPKGMHWKTYRRLEERDEELRYQWTVSAMKWMQRKA